MSNHATKLLIILFLCQFQNAFGQAEDALNKKKSKIEQSIQSTQKELKSTQSKKKATLSDYNSIQKKIKSRSGKIELVREELNYVASLVKKKNKSVESLKSEIAVLKKEYANIMQRAYKANLVTNEWMLILSATSMNQAFHRWKYLKNIKQSRKKKAIYIANKQIALENEMASLMQMKQGKQFLLNTEEKESRLLTADLNKKNEVLANLSQNEKQLLTKLQKQKKEARAIEVEIEKAIRREIEKKEREARKLAEAKRKREAEEASSRSETAKASVTVASDKKTTPNSNVAEKKKSEKLSVKKNVEVLETPESANLSEQFQNNRGKLPWPVQRGAIVRGFGLQAHPELVHVTINNNGIDIKTDPGSDAKAIFSGEVVHIAFLAGYKNTVMINHGKYYSVYSNLDNVSVVRGQKVSKGTSVGNVGKNGDTGNTELHFEIWSKQSPVNPASWLKSK